MSQLVGHPIIQDRGIQYAAQPAGRASKGGLKGICPWGGPSLVHCSASGAAEQGERLRSVQLRCSIHNGDIRQGERRVVVTGMGVVSCLGHEVDEFYNNLLEVGIAAAFCS